MQSGKSYTDTLQNKEYILSSGFEGGQKSDTKTKNAVTSKSVGKKDGIFGSKNQKSKQQSNYEKKREI